MRYGAFGLVEVVGSSNAVIVIDQMLKTADVSFLTWNGKCGGHETVFMTGDVSAVAAAVQAVKENPPCEIVFAVGIRKTGIFAGNMDTDVGGRCKRISLYMIDGKDIMPKLVTAFQRFVGGITFSVDGLKLLF